jgi:hypothetical protein
MVAELKMVCSERLCRKQRLFEKVKQVNAVATVHIQVEQLACIEQFHRLSEAVKEKYIEVFSLIPHIDLLPTDVYCQIKLKDVSKTFATHSYATPRKYKEA